MSREQIRWPPQTPALRDASGMIRELDWSQLTDLPRSVSTCSGTFFHRDNRCWVATIRVAPNYANYTWALRLSSDGCRNYHFVANVTGSIRETAVNFANLAPEFYRRLVADARPTSTHPSTGPVIAFTMSPVQDATRPGVEPLSYDALGENTLDGRASSRRRDRRDEERNRQRPREARVAASGFGRLMGGIVELFPHHDEVMAILDMCVPRETTVTPVVSHLLNRDPNLVGNLEISDEAAENYDRINSIFGVGTFERSDGREDPQPGGRHERQISFFDEEK